jgi:hypothetical protein
MYNYVRVLSIFDKPFIRVSIAAEYEFQTIPFETITDWAIKNMNSRPGSYGNSVFFKNHLILSLKIEFIYFKELA